MLRADFLSCLPLHAPLPFLYRLMHVSSPPVSCVRYCSTSRPIYDYCYLYWVHHFHRIFVSLPACCVCSGTLHQNFHFSASSTPAISPPHHLQFSFLVHFVSSTTCDFTGVLHHRRRSLPCLHFLTYYYIILGSFYCSTFHSVRFTPAFSVTLLPF